MPGNVELLARSIPVLLAACLAACSETAGRASPDDARRTEGALDNILLCENSPERTPIVFPHAKHYLPQDQGGSAIECAVCHHDYEGRDSAPPGSCRTCHVAHDVDVEDPIDTLWIAAHERCGTCHKSPTADYPNAPVYDECDDCHSYPDDVILVGDGLKMSVSVVAEGPFLESDRLERSFREKFEEDDFEVRPRNEATMKATYTFRIVEVFDDLIPRSSKIMLAQGTCAIRFVYENQEVVRRTLRSKVISGRNRQEVHRTITDNLMKSAYRESAKALDEFTYDKMSR